jgi:hypothetical protein
MNIIERIAQLLTELTGEPVSNLAATLAVVVAAVSVLMLLVAPVWIKNSRVDWDAVEAERKRLEGEYDD